MKAEAPRTVGAKALVARGLLGLGLTLSLAGCFVQSLHPLATENDVVFEQRLLGNWVGAFGREKSIITFCESGAATYEVIYQSIDGRRVYFEGRLARLGRFLFLETQPASRTDMANGVTLVHFFPVHQIFRIELEGDVMRIATLDSVKIDARILEVRHERSENGGAFLITAPTAELRKFVFRHAETVFTEVGQWQRQK